MNTSNFSTIALRSPRATAVALAAALSLGACGGGSDDATAFTVSGTVTGLTAPGLVLTNNGVDDLGIAAGKASFVFQKVVGAGAPYRVAVKTQPTGLACAVANGSGNANADVGDVVVTCEASNPGGGTDPGTGPGNGAGQGTSAECFNEALMTAGTSYQWDMQGTVNGKTVTMSNKANVQGGGAFNGVSGLIETRQLLTLTVDAATQLNQSNQTFHTVDRTNGPVIVTHGAISEGTIGGMAMSSRLEYTPPARVRDFTLAVGETYEYVEIVQTTTSVSGTPISFTDTSRQTTTYLGQEQITVPAGTFTACHFKSQTEDGPFDYYHAKGSGLPLQMSSVIDGGQRVTLRMLGSSNINGTPVLSYQAAY